MPCVRTQLIIIPSSTIPQFLFIYFSQSRVIRITTVTSYRSTYTQECEWILLKSIKFCDPSNERKEEGMRERELKKGEGGD